MNQIVEVQREVIDGFLTFSGLNTLYDWRDPESLRWVQDGAFLFHAHRIGLESHVPAFEAILTRLKDEKISSPQSPIASLSDRLWGEGHPMQSLGT